jgi:hypothetical protein
VPSPCAHFVSVLVCTSSPSSHSDYTSLPSPFSSPLRHSLRMIDDNILMLLYPQGTVPSKIACFVYASIPMYRPRPTPTPTKHHRSFYFSWPTFYYDKTPSLIYIITTIVFSPRVSSSIPSAFSPQEHHGCSAPRSLRIPLLCSTLDEMFVLVFRMFCLNLLLSQGLCLTFLLD